MSELSTLPVAVILGMSAVTYLAKAGGLWMLDRVSIPDRGRAGIEALPTGLLVAILVPRLVRGGPAEWAGAAGVTIVAARTDSLLVSLAVGLGIVLLLRGTPIPG